MELNRQGVHNLLSLMKPRREHLLRLNLLYHLTGWIMRLGPRLLIHLMIKRAGIAAIECLNQVYPHIHGTMIRGITIHPIAQIGMHHAGARTTTGMNSTWVRIPFQGCGPLFQQIFTICHCGNTDGPLRNMEVNAHNSLRSYTYPGACQTWRS